MLALVGSGCVSRSYRNSVASERMILRTTLRDDAHVAEKIIRDCFICESKRTNFQAYSIDLLRFQCRTLKPSAEETISSEFSMQTRPTGWRYCLLARE